MNGELIGPGHIQDTMRMNGAAAATYIGGSIVELAPGQTPKGSVGSSPSASEASTNFNANSIIENSNDNTNVITVPHIVVNKSVFDKGLSDGQKDAKTNAKMNAKTMTITSTTSSDDVDCESPGNLSGQDSIDYCKGYEQGFTELL